MAVLTHTSPRESWQGRLIGVRDNIWRRLQEQFPDSLQVAFERHLGTNVGSIGYIIPGSIIRVAASVKDKNRASTAA